jgi:hypothetical protein
MIAKENHVSVMNHTITIRWLKPERTIIEIDIVLVKSTIIELGFVLQWLWLEKALKGCIYSPLCA